jgi:hypothetical protein
MFMAMRYLRRQFILSVIMGLLLAALLLWLTDSGVAAGSDKGPLLFPSK